jgi:uncharacterized protein (DUF3820 family)
MEITDNSIMPFGEHKGKTMANVPDSYLLFLYENCKIWPNLRKYIADNMDSIIQNIERKKKK